MGHSKEIRDKNTKNLTFKPKIKDLPNNDN